MGKYKENPRYCTVSMRISDEEKLMMKELVRQSRLTLSSLMREAILAYIPYRLGGVQCEQE